MSTRGLQPIGVLAQRVVEDTARRAIAYWLGEASRSSGREREAAFRTADGIRQTAGLSWADAIEKVAA